MASRNYKALIATASVPLIMTLGNSILIPVLPTLQRVLKVSSLQISMLITVYSVAAILMIPLAGYLSDRFGRKRIMIPSLIIAGVGGLVSGLAPLFAGEAVYGVILAGRLIQGIGAAGAAPIVMPLVGDMYKSEKEVSGALGIVETSNTLGKVVSPILGALLALWTWTALFLSIPIFCLVSILLILFFIHVPSRDNKQQAQSIRDFVATLVKTAKAEGRWLSAIFIIGATAMLVLFGVLFYLSEVLEEVYKMTGVLKGAMLAIPLSALCLSSYLSGKWIGESKPHMKWVSLIGLALLTAALIVIASTESQAIWLLFLCMGVGGIGIGAALPCMDALITEGIDKEQRGTVTSLYSSMRFIGVAAGPPLVSIGMSRFPDWLFYGLAGLTILSILYGLVAIKPGDGSESDREPAPARLQQSKSPT
ncbi:MFS transporter [Paenibacillus daejeonensis]|uniref:MFS transporter n=1 Tax=Paenibacillus daejeonensis TaxID=135193 RepID=UPI00036706C3|nr:MFS transporter [Paenibacillus daejeonensis]